MTMTNDFKQSHPKITADGKQMDLPLLLMKAFSCLCGRSPTGDNITWDDDGPSLTLRRQPIGKAPVTITDIGYEPDKDRDGEFAKYLISEHIRATIPKDKLWYIVDISYTVLKKSESAFKENGGVSLQ